MTIRPIALAALLAAAPLGAHAQSWTIDPAHTSIIFTIEHLGFSQVTGTFRDIAAEVSFDPDAIASTEVAFTVQAESIDTFWPARDEHVRGADFLDVANHPEITFASTAIAETGETTAEVTGELTIRGVTESVTLDATLNQLGPNPFQPETTIAGFTLTGEIDRTAFGIDFGAPAIGAVMPITVNVELIQAG